MKIIKISIFLLLITSILTSCNCDVKTPVKTNMIYETTIEIRYSDNTIDTITDVFVATESRKTPRYDIYVRNNLGILVSYIDRLNTNYIATDVKRFKILSQEKLYNYEK